MGLRLMSSMTATPLRQTAALASPISPKWPGRGRIWGRLGVTVVLTLLAAAVEPAVTAQAASITLYVAPSGTDMGSCQVASTPCKTITYALTQAPSPHSTLPIAAG